MLEQLPLNQVVCGDCIEILANFEDNSIDCCVTDPPYFMINVTGKGFMGKEWDSLNNRRIYKILCQSKEFAQFVSEFLWFVKVDSNMVEENFVQSHAKTKDSLNQKLLTSTVQSAEKKLHDINHRLKANINSVQGLVLTKAEVLDLLNELSPNPTTLTVFRNLPENVLFVVPLLCLKNKLKNIVPENVLSFPIVKPCVDTTILLTLMAEARINGVIEGTVGSILGNRFMQETNTDAENVENIATERKYKHITLNHTEKQKTTHWIIWLLYVLHATQKWKTYSRTVITYDLIYKFHRNWAEECFRVLKPGALAFVMCSPRQDVLWRTLSALEDAGFQLRQSFVSWIYKSGFPKAYDVSKGIDKKGNRLKISNLKLKEELNKLRKSTKLSLSEINKICNFEASNYFRVDNHLISIFPNEKKWQKLKSVLKPTVKMEKQLDQLFKEAKREIIGKKDYGSSRNFPLPTTYDGKRVNLDVTAPSTDLAKKWSGWKSITGLKPATEVIIQACKPFVNAQPIFLFVANLLLSLRSEEKEWLKLIALTVDKSSILDPQFSKKDGVNSVHSNVKTITNIKRLHVNNVEEYFEWLNHPNVNSVPNNVPIPIIQALETRLGREVGSSEAMAISQSIKEIEHTDSNMMLLWRNILVALLLKMSSVTTKTVSETITELRILNSLLSQSTFLSITRLREIVQNGKRFDALTVVNCFKSVFSQLNNIHLIAVQENAISNMVEQNSSVSNAEESLQLSNSTKILESIAHGSVTTKLVPKSEVIIMVNKPMSEATIVDNVLKHGVGAVNVDACRIPYEKGGTIADNPLLRKETGAKINYGIDANPTSFCLKKQEGQMNINQKGRFPANLLVSAGALDTGKIEKSKSGGNPTNVKCHSWMGEKISTEVYHDIGGQSRYFDLDAWAKHHGFLDVTKASKAERNMGLEELKLVKDGHIASSTGGGGGWKKDTKKNPNLPRKNIHPTVKPVKLMAYLIELGCPEGGVVLDPFCGSGSTLIAAHRLNRKWIGIEIDKEYAEITRHRLSVLNQKLTDFCGSKG